MMRRIVGLMTSCMKDQGMHIEFKENYNKKEILRSSIPQKERTSILMVGSEVEDEDEAWVKVEARLLCIALNLKKCILFSPFGVLLGHIVCKQGFLVDPSKIAIIVDLPPPTSIR
jgi:hypothetical protein